jgi:hypothetical protein
LAQQAGGIPVFRAFVRAEPPSRGGKRISELHGTVVQIVDSSIPSNRDLSNF